MNYFDWGPLFVNPRPTEPGHKCYQCGKDGARVQHVLQEDYIEVAPHSWRVRDDAPVRYKCNVVRDCDVTKEAR